MRTREAGGAGGASVPGAARLQGAPCRAVGAGSGPRAGGGARGGSKPTRRRRRRADAGLRRGRECAPEGTRPESDAGSDASPEEAANSRPQRGKGGGAGGGRRRRGPPSAPPPGQRPWPRALCWFRVVRQPQRRRDCGGPGGGGGGGAARPCALSGPEPLHALQHEGQWGLQGPATHGETPSPFLLDPIRGPDSRLALTGQSRPLTPH